jgi:hypothetical protein
MNSFQDLFDRQKLHFARGATQGPLSAQEFVRKNAATFTTSTKEA